MIDIHKLREFVKDSQFQLIGTEVKSNEKYLSKKGYIILVLNPPFINIRFQPLPTDEYKGLGFEIQHSICHYIPDKEDTKILTVSSNGKLYCFKRV